MTAAAIDAPFARTQLMPGLRRVEHQSLFVDGLKREGGVGRDLGKKTGIGIAVGIRGLASAIKFAEWNFAQYPQAFRSVTVEPPATRMSGCRRLHSQNPNRMDLGIVVEPDIAALIVKIERHAVAVTRECVQPSPGIIAAGISGGDSTLWNHSVGVAFPFVNTGCTNETEGRACRQMG